VFGPSSLRLEILKVFRQSSLRLEILVFRQSSFVFEFEDLESVRAWGARGFVGQDAVCGLGERREVESVCECWNPFSVWSHIIWFVAVL